ncbi:MAG: hypothetical protein Q8Q06_03070 [bacterium]|nr:hypothetical protein [bacterium]
MIQKISEYLKVEPEALKSMGVFDAIIGIDTHLFLDSQLLKDTEVPEFKSSYKKLQNYFSKIIKLLIAYKNTGNPRLLKEAQKLLIFHETKGIYVGYSSSADDGNAMGLELGRRLLKSALEIVSLGVEDPELFELIGLFEEGFGADRISDMVISVIADDILSYSQRIADNLNIEKRVEIIANQSLYRLVPHPDNNNKSLVFLPRELLNNLPVALGWDEISYVAKFNEMVRSKLNELVGNTWKKGGKVRKVKKQDLKDLLLKNPQNIKQLIDAHKNSKPIPYNVEEDEDGVVKWYEAKIFAEEYPLSIGLPASPKYDDYEKIVKKIILKFKNLIEINGLNEHLYISKGKIRKRRHERYSQLLFYAIADSYCEANNLDISREPNAGRGPVDFKFSRGYRGRLPVEIKLSSNPALIKGYKKQLPTYMSSESATNGFYVVIQVTKSKANINNLLKLRDKQIKEGINGPEIFIIDGLLRPSASK